MEPSQVFWGDFQGCASKTQFKIEYFAWQPDIKTAKKNR